MLRELSTVPGRENLLRRVLGLPGSAPDPVGFDFVSSPSGLITFERADPEALERRRAAWHAEDWRADVADALARAPVRMGRFKDRLRAEFEVARGSRALAAARTLRYTSHYVHPTSGCADIEGYFDFGNDSYFQLQLVAAGAMRDYAQGEWERGCPVSDEHNLLGRGHFVMVPCDEFTPELASEALRLWYLDRFSFVRGHWTHMTGTQPHITVDLEWSKGKGSDDAHVQAVR